MEAVFDGVNTAFLIKNGSVLGGAALLTYLGLNFLKRSLGNEEYSVVKNLITPQEFELLRCSEWIEITFKFYEFYNLVPSLYLKLLRRIIKFLQFKKELDGKKVKLGIPRIARSYLHPVIESIREMRYIIEKNFGTSYLKDFDDLACEIQNIHNNCASNILMDSI